MTEFMGNMLLISGVAGALICIACLASPRLLKGCSAKWRYYVWLILAVRLLVPLDFSIPGRAAQVPIPLAVSQAVPPSLDEGNTGGTIGTGNPVGFIGTGNAAGMGGDSNVSHYQDNELMPPAADREAIEKFQSADAAKRWFQKYGLLSIWLAGMAAFGVWNGIGYYAAMKRLRRFRRGAGEKIAAELKKQAAQAGIKRSVSVYLCSCINTPMAAGLLDSAVYLPVREYGEEELAFILRHECIHIARRDLWYQGIMLMVKIMHWFNPAVYLMASRAREDMELVCDELAASGMDKEQRFLYNQILLAEVERKQGRKIYLSTQFYGDFKELKTRVSRMMEGKPRRSGMLLAAVFFAAAVSFSLLVACGNSHQEPLENPNNGNGAVSHSVANPEEPVQTDLNGTDDAETPANQEDGQKDSGGILLAREGNTEYYLRQWTEEDEQNEAYLQGGSNYPVKWLGKLVKITDGTETVLYDLVDYDLAAQEAVAFAGDRIVFYGSIGYSTMEMKTITYISVGKDGGDPIFYDGDPVITSQVFYDNGYLYYESYDGPNDDNQYPRRVMRMNTDFTDRQEVARIEGLLITVRDQNVYYIANDRMEKDGIYKLELKKGAEPVIYDKIGFAASTHHFSDVTGVRLVADMADRTVFDYDYTEDIGADKIKLRLEIAKEFNPDEYEVFSGPALVKNGSVIVFAEESAGRFSPYEPLSVGVPLGTEIKTGDYVTVYYNGMVLESYPAQLYAETVSVRSNPASFELPEGLTVEQAASAGCYVMGSGGDVRNEEVLERFISAAGDARIPVFLRVAEFDENQKPHITDIYYTGTGFHQTQDSLRADGSKNAVVRDYQFMNSFDNGALVILSNEEELTREEFERRMFSSKWEDTIDFFFLKQD